jgi:hypothetical protein
MLVYLVTIFFLLLFFKSNIKKNKFLVNLFLFLLTDFYPFFEMWCI